MPDSITAYHVTIDTIRVVMPSGGSSVWLQIAPTFGAICVALVAMAGTLWAQRRQFDTSMRQWRDQRDADDLKFRQSITQWNEQLALEKDRFKYEREAAIHEKMFFKRYEAYEELIGLMEPFWAQFVHEDGDYLEAFQSAADFRKARKSLVIFLKRHVLIMGIDVMIAAGKVAVMTGYPSMVEQCPGLFGPGQQMDDSAIKVFGRKIHESLVAACKDVRKKIADDLGEEHPHSIR